MKSARRIDIGAIKSADLQLEVKILCKSFAVDVGKGRKLPYAV